MKRAEEMSFVNSYTAQCTGHIGRIVSLGPVLSWMSPFTFFADFLLAFQSCMSRITNLLITFSCGERERRILTQLRKHIHRGNPFRIVSVKDAALPEGWYRGSKYLETGLLVGAHNYLDLPALLAFMQGMSWEVPEEVQLLVKEQLSYEFRIIDLFPEV